MILHIVVNPAGASGSGIKLWKRLEPLFQGHEYIVHESTVDHMIEDICRELTTDLKEDINLIVIGGDGTINGAINGIQDFEHTRFGMIPSGTSNDLATDLKLPKDRSIIVKRILEDKIQRTYDLGEIIYHNEIDIIDPVTGQIIDDHQEREYTRLFNNGAGMGFDAEICYRVIATPMKKALNVLHLGKLVYIMKAIQVIFQNKRVPVRVKYSDKEVFYPQCLFVAGMNHRYQGGGFLFCPKAQADDEIVDVCIADQLNNFDFFRMFPYAYKGNHVKFNGVYQERDTSFEVWSEEPLWIQTDGEVHSKSTHVTIRIAKEKLHLLM